MPEVKIYRIEGYMLVGHDRAPTWQKFVKEVRALSERQALEQVYSVLGSNHKVRRKQIRIAKVEEISVNEALDRRVVDLARAERFVKVE